MLTSNLRMLLSERNIKITQAAYDTGISRTTLTALASGGPSGINLSTMNTLCIYLDVTPDKLFTYAPFDIKVNAKRGGASEPSLVITIRDHKKEHSEEITVIIDEEKKDYGDEDGEDMRIERLVVLFPQPNDLIESNSLLKLTRYLSQLSLDHRRIFEGMVADAVLRTYGEGELSLFEVDVSIEYDIDIFG